LRELDLGWDFDAVQPRRFGSVCLGRNLGHAPREAAGYQRRVRAELEPAPREKPDVGVDWLRRNKMAQ